MTKRKLIILFNFYWVALIFIGLGAFFQFGYVDWALQRFPFENIKAFFMVAGVPALSITAMFIVSLVWFYKKLDKLPA